jgi:hypothetical protein
MLWLTVGVARCVLRAVKLPHATAIGWHLVTFKNVVFALTPNCTEENTLNLAEI